LASRNEDNVAPINATKLFFLQAFKMVGAFELMYCVNVPWPVVT
jgi:hypothetical protein